MQKGSFLAAGIPYVIINGTVVVEDSKVLAGVYAGNTFEMKSICKKIMAIEHSMAMPYLIT